MPTSPEGIAELYAKIAENESNRLTNHPMERELTLRAIRQGLASSIDTATSTKRIADVGGGPGKLAFALADEGHHVDLVDLSPDLIYLAKTEQDERASVGNKSLLASITVGNALDMPMLPEGSYDAVLLLGPLYHLLDEAERKKAIENACYLAKPRSGLVFCAFISIEAHLRDIAMRDPARIVEKKDFYTRYLADGRYQKLNESLTAGVQSFHTHSGDIRSFYARYFTDTFDFIELRSTEGILGGGLDAKLVDASSEIVQAWADLLFEKYSTNEEHLGCADHLLAVFRRK
ncbi:unnamed protein product [Clonostachys rosea]|uniref:Methyltransferase domain-containing protein n=1 Tax=Bionectria ochroleuca TaxID=29856 RepID=A0ABY6TVY3_BIOOC|nr:unnamed protein product [Clonostachys rosea]